MACPSPPYLPGPLTLNAPGMTGIAVLLITGTALACSAQLGHATWFELHEDLLVTLRIPAPDQPPRGGDAHRRRVSGSGQYRSDLG